MHSKKIGNYIKAIILQDVWIGSFPWNCHSRRIPCLLASACSCHRHTIPHLEMAALVEAAVLAGCQRWALGSSQQPAEAAASQPPRTCLQCLPTKKKERNTFTVDYLTVCNAFIQYSFMCIQAGTAFKTSPSSFAKIKLWCPWNGHLNCFLIQYLFT